MVVNRIDCDGWYFLPLALVRQMLDNDSLVIWEDRITSTVQGRILQHQFGNPTPELVFTKGRDSGGRLKNVKAFNPKSPVLLTNLGKDKLTLWYIPLSLVDEFGADVINDYEALIRISTKALKSRIIQFPFDMGDRIINPEKYYHLSDLNDLEIVDRMIPIEN